ncbi:Cytochrome [Forsythia ovata]|uniref:Cytochrome n=1 Tax=Forsythia ovata TaxID=205694 RepID=A0ABD1WNT1_9LAMI
MGRNPHIKLASMAQTYGPVMSFRLGTGLVVVGSSPKAAMEILKTQDRFLCARRLSYTHPASSPKVNKFSVGFANECNDQWKYLRSICRAELFSNRALQSQMKIREKNVMKMVRYLHEKEGQVLNISELIFNTLLNTMCNILFSMDVFGPEGGGKGVEVKKLVGKFVKIVATPNLADLFPILHGWDIQGMQKKVRKINEKIFTIWKDIIKERREKRRRNILTQEDFLDALLGNGFSNDHINHMLLELLMAATETSTTATIWAVADLIKNQESRHKLCDELNKNIGNHMIKEPEIMDFPYLQACLKESMRLHPPVPFLLPRRATETCKVMNFTIPKGSQVLVNTWAMGRDPTVWVDSSSFKPERFLDSGLDFKGNDFEFVPFGSGRRMCPGLPIVTRQVPYVVATLMHKITWSLPGYNDPTELNMDEVYHLELLKKEPLQLIPKLKREV